MRQTLKKRCGVTGRRPTFTGSANARGVCVSYDHKADGVLRLAWRAWVQLLVPKCRRRGCLSLSADHTLPTCAACSKEVQEQDSKEGTCSEVPALQSFRAWEMCHVTEKVALTDFKTACNRSRSKLMHSYTNTVAKAHWQQVAWRSLSVWRSCRTDCHVPASKIYTYLFKVLATTAVPHLTCPLPVGFDFFGLLWVG